MSQITEEKINALSDGNWKVKLEMLEQIDVCKRLRALEEELPYQKNIANSAISMLGQIAALCKADENDIDLNAVKDLIAQRDELLAALQAVVAVWDDIYPDMESGKYPQSRLEHAEFTEMWQAKLAIAKAVQP